MPLTTILALAACGLASTGLLYLVVRHRRGVARHRARLAEHAAQIGELGRLNRDLRARLEQREGLEQKVRSSERAVQQGEERAKLILEHAPIGIVTLDREGRFLSVNAAFAEMTGHDRARLGGKWFLDMVERGELPVVMDLLDRVLRGESGVARADLVLLRADQRRLETVVRAAPVRTAKEGSATVIVQVEDVTSEREAQRALERHAQALERRNKELAQFAHLFAHDLQEPLRDVTSYVQLLSRKLGAQLDADGKEYVAYAVTGAERAKQLLMNVLAYTDLDSRPLETTSIDLNGALDEALRRLSAGGLLAGTRVTHGELPTVHGDAALVTDLFAELVTNAVKFHGAGAPHVHVDAERRGKEWLVRVADDGPGIEARFREQVFGIFKRLAGRDVPGSGMGLALARKIVERHGGQISVEDREGPGATFAFTLPDARSDVPPSPGSPENAGLASA